MVSSALARARLTDRLTGSEGAVAIVAAPGYGKSTLIGQWERLDGRPFIRVHPGDGASAALPDSDADPVVVVVDAMESLDDGADALIDEVTGRALPAGSTVVVSGRRMSPAALLRLRLDGALILTERDLRFDIAETAQALGRDAAAAEHVHRITDGWPAGVRLAAAALAEAGDSALSFAGDDQVVRDYLRLEVLPALDAETRAFFEVCALLPSLTGALCDAVRGATDSQTVLERLAEEHLFVVAVDRAATTFRMVPLVRQAFVAELERREPERAREVRTAAADWLARSGSRQDALVLRLANGDRDDALTLLSDVVLPMFSSGRLDDLVALIHGIGPEAAQRSGYLATMIAYAGVMTGDVVCARRWGVAADEFYRTHRYADATEAAAHLTLRAHIAPAGAHAMRADARRALELVGEGDPWAAPALMLAGTAAALCGDLGEAAALLTEAAHVGRERQIWPASLLALAERAVLADESGDATSAKRVLGRARALLVEADLGAYPHAVMVYALAGTIAAREGRRSEAARDLAAADRLLTRIGRALPWLGIQARVTAARGRLALGDGDDAAELVAQARTLMSRFPDAPRLARDLDALTRALTELATGAGGRGLTPAEMRLLPLLPTRATFEEIGVRLHVSRNTVKTHAVSVYRKLGATSRSEAVERARSLGLLPR